MPGVIKQDSNVHLLIAGNDESEYSKKIKKKLSEHNLKYIDDSNSSDYLKSDRFMDKNVTFTGYLNFSSKLEALVASDLFVLPSYSENFGMSVIEAMLCGTPVIISDKVGISVEVKKNNAGIITKCDVNELTLSIIDFFEDESLRKRLILNAKQFSENNYDINIVAMKMIDEFNLLLN